eukprot:7841438-Lingulodinium_polyedra.AAC.1
MPSAARRCRPRSRAAFSRPRTAAGDVSAKERGTPRSSVKAMPGPSFQPILAADRSAAPMGPRTCPPSARARAG